MGKSPHLLCLGFHTCKMGTCSYRIAVLWETLSTQWIGTEEALDGGLED